MGFKPLDVISRLSDEAYSVERLKRVVFQLPKSLHLLLHTFSSFARS